MRKRSWKVALAAFALVATAMAFYVQFFERQARQEEDRLAAVRLEDALEESRSRAEILAQRRARISKGTAKEESTEQPSDQPLPDTVLRRGESGGGSSLQQVRDSQDEQEIALTRLQESLDDLALQVERSDQALRRDLEEIRAGVRRDREASSKTLSLLLIALIPIVVFLLISLWPSGGKEG